MNSVSEAILKLKRRLIVSCQAPEGDPFHSSEAMVQFAEVAVEGGAGGIRANGPADVSAIRRTVTVPIIGISKRWQADGEVLITGSFEEARELITAGADIIALDCTQRGRHYGALERLAQIKTELGVPAVADIATVEEAIIAAGGGADAVLSTLRGFTPGTTHVRVFEPSFIAALHKAVSVPVLAEGRIGTPEAAAEALAAGALAVIVGAAITRPRDVARRFVLALDPFRALPEHKPHLIGIDLGATKTKSGVLGPGGEMLMRWCDPTPAGDGRKALLDHLKRVAKRATEFSRAQGAEPAALGVATAGWVDPFTGVVLYATENLSGWSGTRITEELRAELGFEVAAENDANALALAEKYFGIGKSLQTFVCITLGTGVGGACFINGRLNRGAHFFGNAIGHIQIDPNGPPCTCGHRGCLEVYANAAALMRYAEGGGFAGPEDVIRAANSGIPAARNAVETLACYLARGCASVVALLDPQAIILGGGLVEENPCLVADLEMELTALVPAWQRPGLRISVSRLRYHGGVLGAAVVALEALMRDPAAGRG
jgi:N-acetylmannosamine-6-phosphate 2-epimerase/N-acetylmannosamine kinase